MGRPQKWKEIANSSRLAIEGFRDSEDDKAIVWADDEIKCYKEAMLALKEAILALVRGNGNWAMTVTDDQEILIKTMLRRQKLNKKVN
jgi:hypothetical protein